MNILVVFVLLLSACTSNTVKMTSEETNDFFDRRSEIDKSFSDFAKSDKYYRFRYQDCSSTKNSQSIEDCYLFECRGIQKDRTCWKTVISGKAAQELREELCCKKLSSQQRNEKLTSCLSDKEELVSKRRNCFEFLQSLRFDAKMDEPEAEKVFHVLCDLKGTFCTKNKQKTGKGFMGENAEHGSTRMGSFSLAGNSSSESIAYTFLIDNR